MPRELENVDDWWELKRWRDAFNFQFTDYGFLSGLEKNLIAWIKAHNEASQTEVSNGIGLDSSGCQASDSAVGRTSTGGASTAD